MGIFDLFKKQPVTTHAHFDKYFPDHEAQQERLKYQTELLNSVNEANAKYANDGDIESLINVYEHAFIESNPPCHSSQNLKLVDLYLKTGQNNKAWMYLNSLIASQEAPMEKIRHEQSRILKKEKRYIPALEMIMSEHLFKYTNRNGLNREAFLKDAGVCTRALKWNESTLNDLADIVERQIKLKQSDYDDSSLHKEYETYLKENGLLDKEG